MYEPRPYLGGDIATYLADELRAIAQSQSDTLDAIQLNTLHAAPAKPREGMVVKADGSDWSPGGGGAGFYGYRGGSWRKFD